LLLYYNSLYRSLADFSFSLPFLVKVGSFAKYIYPYNKIL